MFLLQIFARWILREELEEAETHHKTMDALRMQTISEMWKSNDILRQRLEVALRRLEEGTPE